MNQIEQRSDKEEGELQRLRDTAEHRRNRRGDEKRRRLFLLLRFCAYIDSKCRARQTKHLAAAVQSKAALREEIAKALRTRHKVVDVPEPVRLNAAVYNCRSIDERKVDEVVQTCRQKNLLRKRVCPDTDDAAGFEEKLELLNGVLYRRPNEAEEKCHRNHDDKADRNDECRSFENAKPVGNVCIIKMIVQKCRTAGNENRTEHAHVERLDIRDHRKPCTGSCILCVVHAEHIRMKRQECGDEVVEQHVDDKRLHRAARRFFFGKADRYGNGKENGHLREHRPRALFDDEPEIIPERSLCGKTAKQSLVLTDDRYRHRETKECEQNDGRIHCTAEPLHVLHDDILTKCHVLSSLKPNPETGHEINLKSN